ncbi:CRISPR-associated endonuclease Cas2 [Butyrivibrio sp. AC2005]|uniref:CRISPR-associated endonuclease Cas2 n=1 Tax=Butyrivibrio sp. AC2005 TaxID=1280672 RepID=UPI00041D192E|nr:CRISPR-associated endonuclease Cas2 [Butyrivibrio sp. AC2005]
MVTKYMKMLCMFDLPVETSEEQRAYRKFRKDIMSEGFIMIQYSVYVRTCPNREFANQLEKRIQKFVPKEGNVRLLTVTEKQYEDMKLLVGSKKLSETALGMERMIII